jgi:hypothetical protein
MSRPGEARWPPPLIRSMYRTPLGSTTSFASFTSCAGRRATFQTADAGIPASPCAAGVAPDKKSKCPTHSLPGSSCNGYLCSPLICCHLQPRLDLQATQRRCLTLQVCEHIYPTAEPLPRAPCQQTPAGIASRQPSTCSETTPKVRKPSHARPPASPKRRVSVEANQSVESACRRRCFCCRCCDSSCCRTAAGDSAPACCPAPSGPGSAASRGVGRSFYMIPL